MTNHKNKQTDHESNLAVMRYLENKNAIGQRELSQNLGISLGKINFILKALIEKGIVKSRNFKNNKNKSAYAYYLTPEGFKEKAKMTLNFFKRKNDEYNQLKAELTQLKNEINNMKQNRKKK